MRHPLDWNGDGRVGIGDGAFTEIVHDEMTGSNGASQGGCSCGCLLAFLVAAIVLIAFAASGGMAG